MAIAELGKAKIYKSRDELDKAEQAILVAIQYFKKYQKIYPEDYQGFLALGDIFLNEAQEKRQAAIEAQKVGRTEDADKLQLESKNLANAALEELQQAFRFLPLNMQVLNSLGKAYMETGQCSKAEEFFRKALDIEEKNDIALFNSGLNYLECFNKPDRAREVFLNLLKIKPDDPRALFYLKQIDSGTLP